MFEIAALALGDLEDAIGVLRRVPSPAALESDRAGAVTGLTLLARAWIGAGDERRGGALLFEVLGRLNAIAAYRRRWQALSAIVEAAGEISARDRLRRVLEECTRRARSFELESTRADLFCDIAGAAVAAGEESLAMELAAGCRAERFRQSEIRVGIAGLAVRQGRYDDAIRHLRRVRISHWWNEFLNAGGRDLGRQARFGAPGPRSVLEAMEPLVREEPESACSLALRLLEAGDERRALELFERSVRPVNDGVHSDANHVHHVCRTLEQAADAIAVAPLLHRCIDAMGHFERKDTAIREAAESVAGLAARALPAALARPVLDRLERAALRYGGETGSVFGNEALVEVAAARETGGDHDRALATLRCIRPEGCRVQAALRLAEICHARGDRRGSAELIALARQARARIPPDTPLADGRKADEALERADPRIWRYAPEVRKIHDTWPAVAAPLHVLSWEPVPSKRRRAEGELHAAIRDAVRDHELDASPVVLSGPTFKEIFALVWDRLGLTEIGWQIVTACARSERLRSVGISILEGLAQRLVDDPERARRAIEVAAATLDEDNANRTLVRMAAIWGEASPATLLELFPALVRARPLALESIHALLPELCAAAVAAGAGEVAREVAGRCARVPALAAYSALRPRSTATSRVSSRT